MEQNTNLVSVCMITYKHDRFISQAILGVLDQNLNIDFELLIFDDNSPDNTEPIVKEIINRHPKGSLIKYFKNGLNLGVMQNFQNALMHCHGKYIALCEGDDFWINDQKIKKQISFLEKNPKYVACFHNALTKEGDEIIGNYSGRLNSGEIKTEDIIKVGGGIFPTASLVFRNMVFFDFPKFDSFISGDRLLALNLIKNGKFYYFSDLMSVYRLHNQGVYTSILNDSYKKAKVYHSNLNLLNYFEEKYYPDFQSAFIEAKSIQSRYYILSSQNKFRSYIDYAKYLNFKDFFKLLKSELKNLFKRNDKSR